MLYVIILHMFLLYKTRKCVSVEEKQANESGLYIHNRQESVNLYDGIFFLRLRLIVEQRNILYTD